MRFAEDYGIVEHALDSATDIAITIKQNPTKYQAAIEPLKQLLLSLARYFLPK